MCSTLKFPLIDADALTTNPKFGESTVVNEPLCKSEVSNDKLAILMLVNPLPSPTNDEPDDTITLPPVTNNPPLILSEPDIFVLVPISNPLLGDITASTEPDIILSNLRSCNAFAGMLNNPLPSPSNLDAVIGTLTNNFSGST